MVNDARAPEQSAPKYNPSTTIQKFKHKKEPTGYVGTNNDLLNSTLNKIKDDILAAAETVSRSLTDNITKREREAIRSLKENENIVINKADKGSTVVVVNKSDYIEEGLKHLDDPNVYRKLTRDTTPEIYAFIMRFLKTLRWQGWIPRSFVDYCTPPEDYRTSQLYFLKKIHKNPMGIRPIVSSVNFVTENLSSFIDGWLNPLVTKLPSYVKDSPEFIKMIARMEIPEDAILVSIDVSSLYTNIPHEEGIKACIEALTSCSDPDPLQPPIEIIEEMLNIVLKNNVMEFNGEFFLQLQGTAMGTKMAPAYANLFMGSLEPKLQSLGRGHIHVWRRFIDDIFLIWIGSHEQLTNYIKQINSIHPTIKFTYEKSDRELTFLDVVVYKGPTFNETHILDTKTHIKPTNKQLYVHRTSYHPNSVKKAIPKGETVRYLRSNSRRDTYQQIVKRLKLKLLQRGYKAKELMKIIKEFPHSRRAEFLTKNNRKETKAPLVIPIKFGPMCEAIKGIIQTHWPEINKDGFLKSIFKERPMIAKRKNKTLANILVRSKVTSNEPNRALTNSSPPQSDPRPVVTANVVNLFPSAMPMRKCGQRNCSVCQRLLLTHSIHVRHLKYNVLIPHQQPPMTCTTKNVVYVVKCKVHHKIYVGQTTQMVRVRINKHIATVKSFKRGLRRNIGHHFNDETCSLNNLVWTPVQVIDNSIPKREAEEKLKVAETHWIRKLCSLQPWGMNYIEVDEQIRT